MRTVALLLPESHKAMQRAGLLPEDWVIFLGFIVSHRLPFGTHDFTTGETRREVC